MVPSRRPRPPPVEVSGLVNVGGRGTHLGEAPLPDAAENDHGASPEDDSSGCWFSWFSYHTPILQKKARQEKDSSSSDGEQVMTCTIQGCRERVRLHRFPVVWVSLCGFPFCCFLGLFMSDRRRTTTTKASIVCVELFQ